LAIKTVAAGALRRINVPLPASSRTGGPLADTWLIVKGGLPAVVAAGGGAVGGAAVATGGDISGDDGGA